MSTSGSRDGSSAATPATPSPSVAAVSLKLPPYWPADPQIWFAQVESQFKTRNVTSQMTMYDYVVGSLSPDIATEVRDIILKTPDADQYDTLKAALIERTADSEQRRLQQLVTGEELGDRKPSQLLRRMEQLLGDQAAANTQPFLKELFLQRLPSNVRMVLASTPATATIQDLAILADKIMEVSTPPHPSPPIINAVNSDLATELAQLKQELTQLKLALRPQKRSFSRGRSPSPRRPQKNADPQSSFCWYHQSFGKDALQCRQPCSFQTGNDPASH